MMSAMWLASSCSFSAARWTFTREQLYQYAMPDDFASGLESVTSRIYKIRKKLNINAILTVHGYGYRFEK